MVLSVDTSQSTPGDSRSQKTSSRAIISNMKVSSAQSKVPLDFIKRRCPSQICCSTAQTFRLWLCCSAYIVSQWSLCAFVCACVPTSVRARVSALSLTAIDTLNNNHILLNTHLFLKLPILIFSKNIKIQSVVAV